MKCYIPFLINLDKAGFDLPARDNTIKCLSVIDYATKKHVALCILAVNTKKSFDHLDWTTLLAALLHAGIPSAIVEKIAVIYSCPSARIKVNGILSELLQIDNGTRQG